MPDSLLTFTADDVPGLSSAAAAPGASKADPALFEKLILQESGGHQFDKSGAPLTSKKGATGRAQVMPETGPEAAALAGLPWDEIKFRTDPEYNTALGNAYFNKQLEDFGNVGHALAAYNAGPGAMRKALARATEKGDPTSYLQYLPAETRAYVPAILRRYGVTSSEQAAAGAGAQQGKDYYTPNQTQYADIQAPLAGPGLTDYFKQVAASAVESVGSVGQAAGEIGAAVANKVTGTQDYEGKNVLTPAAEAVRGSMSAGGKAAMADAPQGDVLDPSSWKAPDTVPGVIMAGAQGLGSMLPMLLVTLVPGLGEVALAKRAQAAAEALKVATTAGDAAKIAEATSALSEAQAAAKAAALKTKAIGGGSEAAMTGGAAAGDVRQSAAQTVAGMTHEQLMQVPAYQQEFAKSGDEQQARRAVVNSAAQWAGALSAVAGAGQGVFNAKIIEDALMHKGVMSALGGLSSSRVVRAGAGAAAGHVIEGGQEVAEKIGQNAGENIGLGRSVGDNLTRDTVGDFVGGAIVGGAGGAVAGAASSHQHVDPAVQRVQDAANAGGVLSKAAIAGNQSPAGQADIAGKAAALQQQQQVDTAAAAEAAKDPLAAQVQQLEATIRQQGALDALRAEDSPVDPKKVLADLAIAKSTSTNMAQREQAVHRLTQALEWAGVNPAKTVASGIEQIVGAVPEGREQKPAPDLATKRTAADRDADLQAQKAAAPTEFDRQQVEAQAQTNREQRLNAPAAPAPAAGPAAAPAIQPAEQQRLEAAALAGKQQQRKAEDDPRQVIVTRAMKNIEERNGVASPQEAQILAEAGLGRPYDRIDTSLAPQPSMDQKLTQATGIALDKAPREDAVQTKLADTRQADEERARGESRMAAQERTAQARQRGTEAMHDVASKTAAKPAEKPAAAKVIEAMKAVAALRNAEQVAILRTARQHYSAEDMAIMSNAAHAPALLSATDKSRLDALRSAPREESTAREGAPATEPNSGISAPKVGTPAGEGPAVFRKRRATLRQIIQLGLNRVDRRGNEFFLTDGRRDFKLEGPADAQLARKAIHEEVRAGADMADQSASLKKKKARRAKLGRVNFDGIPIAVENQIGSTRQWEDEHGNTGETPMTADYGDVEGTTGADGDGVDIYLAPHPHSGAPVYVIDQYNKDGSFDETKSIAGVRTEAEAKAIYDAHFTDGSGPSRRRAVTQMSTEQFKVWVFSPASKKPAGGDKSGATGHAADAVPAGSDAGRSDQSAGGVDDRGARDARNDVGAADDADAGQSQRGDAQAAPVSDERQRPHVTVQVEGQKRSVPIVDITELDGESTARGDNRFALKRAHADLIKAIASAFGKHVVFFDDVSLGDGFVQPGDNSTIFIGTHTTINPLAVLGHEMWHMIRRENPDAWASVAKVVQAQMGENTPKMFRDDYRPDLKATNTNAPLSEHRGGELEELVSDLGGNAFTDPKFWNQVMAEIAATNGEQATPIITRLVALVQQMVARVAAAIKGGKFKADTFVKDVDAVRDALRTGMAQYAQGRGVRLAALQAQVSKTTQGLQRSTPRTVAGEPAAPDWSNVTRIRTSNGPLTVYRGAKKPLAASDFTLGALGGASGNPSSGLGVWFTTSKGEASTYGTAEAAQLDIRKPKVIKAEDLPGFDDTEEAHRWREKLRAQGYDGLIVTAKHLGKPETHIVAFEPMQVVKPQDGQSSDITRSSAREKSDDAEHSVGQLGQVDDGVPGETPSYGRAQAGSTSVVGRHYGTSPRSHLSASAYGRGLKGGERGRVAEATDKRLSHRIYFYVDQGHGITPESGVGSHAHEVRLNNIYDPKSGLVKFKGGMNGFEQAVVDAGYDGYINREFTTKQGAVVLLGPKHKAVPVKFIGTPAAAKAAKVEEEKPARVGLMSKELNAIEIGNIPGATLRAGTLTVPLGSREEANAELKRIGSSIQLSTARDTDAPIDEAKEVREKYKGTKEWLRAPNGAASKLNERQWVHVRTPSFKAWFGDWEALTREHGVNGVWHDDQKAVSKVVDENGEPKVVYHGTERAGFSEFERPSGKTRGHLGIFASDNPTTAATYTQKSAPERVAEEHLLPLATLEEMSRDPKAFYKYDGHGKYVFDEFDSDEQRLNYLTSKYYGGPDSRTRDEQQFRGVYALFMNLRDPGEQHFEGAIWNGDLLGAYNVILPTEEEPYTDKSGKRNFDHDEAKQIAEELDGDVVPAPGPGMTTDDVVKDARRSKNDGAIIHEVIDDGGGPGAMGDTSNVYVAFEPNQVKSADFNSGAYGIDKDDIRLSPARDTTPISDTHARELAVIRREISVLEKLKECVG